jgi:hypothetical protein
MNITLKNLLENAFLVIYIQKCTWNELAILIKKTLTIIRIFGGSREKLPGREAAYIRQVRC